MKKKNPKKYPKSKPKSRPITLGDIYYEKIYLKTDWKRVGLLIYHLLVTIVDNCVKTYRLMKYRSNIKKYQIPESISDRRNFKCIQIKNIIASSDLEKDIKSMYFNINKKIQIITKEVNDADHSPREK